MEADRRNRPPKGLGLAAIGKPLPNQLPAIGGGPSSQPSAIGRWVSHRPSTIGGSGSSQSSSIGGWVRGLPCGRKYYR
jgi:hypothetical protein